MSGEELKDLLYQRKITQAELASKMCMSTQHMSQALKAADLKSGFLEKVAKAIGVDMSFFYGETKSITTVTTGDNNNGNINAGTCSGNSICGPSEAEAKIALDMLNHAHDDMARMMQEIEDLKQEKLRLMAWIDKLLKQDA